MIDLAPSTLDRHAAKVRPCDADLTHLLRWQLDCLSPDDQTLGELALRHQLTHRDISRAMGIAPGTVTRRLRRLMNRLNDPLVSALCDPACRLKRPYREIGIARFLGGACVSDLARKYGMTPTEILELLGYIRGWYRGGAGQR